jgi:hypothetical protein
MYTVECFGMGHRACTGIKTLERATEVASYMDKNYGSACIVTVLKGDTIVPWKAK